VGFRSGGRTVLAELAESNGLDDGDRPGLRLVYDPAHPERVMRWADWRSGRSGDSRIAAAGAGLVVVTVLVPVMVLRRRTRRFGTLKPGTPLKRVRLGQLGGYPTWHVTFADGTRARYVDTVPTRQALRERLGPDGVLSLKAHAQQALEAEPPPDV
jgi:hypothetical protein